jgi:hypothetical protein
LETLAEGKIIWRWERQKIQGGKWNLIISTAQI